MASIKVGALSALFTVSPVRVKVPYLLNASIIAQSEDDGSMSKSGIAAAPHRCHIVAPSFEFGSKIGNAVTFSSVR